jgi:hypothetical protein
MKVRDALAAWRQRQDQTATAHGRWFWIALGPLRIPVPHPGQLHWHDLHHLALDYPSTLVGEIEVSAYELRTGPANLVIYALCVLAVSLGIVIAPRRTVRAFRRARGRRNLYRCSIPNEEVLEWTTDELRRWIAPR